MHIIVSFYKSGFSILIAEKVNKHGVAVPTSDNWTWSKLFEICEEFRQKIVEEHGEQAAEYYRPIDLEITWQHVYYAKIKAFGGNIIDISTKTMER